MNTRLLVVDDEKNIRRALGMILRPEGYEVFEAGSGEEALERVEEAPPALVLLDVNLPGADGIEILKRLKSRRPSLAVVMISGRATVTAAVEATRAGAFDFLEKPLSKERVLIAVRNALAVGTLSARLTRLEAAEAEKRRLVGSGPGLEAVRRQIAKVGPTGVTVLITGESGTGKELVARALHEASPRVGQALIRVNCAAIPEELIESELFGAAAGSYTGADRDREGKFLLADGGTLFLDEIGDMSLKVQAKVLRALQEGEIQRVGDATIHRVDVRVLAATNKDLEAEVAGGRFREDLFYRLNVVPLAVPPLRERAEDIPELCDHFLEGYARDNGLPPRTLAPEALDALRSRTWRGNIRELRNVLERLAILAEGPVITAGDLARLAPTDAPLAGDGPHESLTSGGPTPEAIRRGGGLTAARKAFEARCIETCLDRTGGNVAQAARWLGVERTTLHKKMQALGIEGRPSRPGSKETNQGNTS